MWSYIQSLRTSIPDTLLIAPISSRLLRTLNEGATRDESIRDSQV